MILASGSPSGGPDFKNLDKWFWSMTNRSSYSYLFVKLFKSLAPGMAEDDIEFL
jgi:hypothetical protein